MNILKKKIDDNKRNSSDSDEQDNEEIVIELVEQTIDQQILEYLFSFELSEEEEKLEKDTAKSKLINELQKKADEEIFSKRVLGELYEFYNIKQKVDKAKKESHIHNKFRIICLFVLNFILN